MDPSAAWPSSLRSLVLQAARAHVEAFTHLPDQLRGGIVDSDIRGTNFNATSGRIQ
ncbi:hypothetical protein SynA1825c_02796 [Synechococcus sp. A18-25c]|nr:hypothetical protein SynA1825c_02796 [Synechococcus sp. A18-25c]